MMLKSKKILVFVMMLITLFTFLGCQDRKADSNEFTVVFYTGLSTSSVVSSKIEPLINVEPNSKIERPEDPTAPGATFLGWYKERDFINEWNFEVDTITGSTVIYAKWSVGDLSITYIFDEAGGSFLSTPVYSYNVTTSVLLPKADRLGSIFLGWIFTPVDEYVVGDKIIKTTTGYSTDLVLYALFENKEFTIRFRSMNDSIPNPKSYVIEYVSDMDFPVLADTATKTFVGWFANDGTLSGDWGFQYVNGEPFLGKALSYDAETDKWEFLPQGITVYAKWADK